MRESPSFVPRTTPQLLSLAVLAIFSHGAKKSCKVEPGNKVKKVHPT